ncbi:MAG: hypothetical protein ACLQAT_23410 [Candidatus Binataceae bacterium]
MQVLTQLLATGRCDFDGEFYKIHGLRLRPQPERDLSANLWCAGGTAQTVEIIANHGVRPQRRVRVTRRCAWRPATRRAIPSSHHVIALVLAQPREKRTPHVGSERSLNHQGTKVGTARALLSAFPLECLGSLVVNCLVR